MAVKYHCPKCNKRYLDWGAEKLGFACPDCEDEKLVRVDHAGAQAAAKPALKRKRKKKAVAKARPAVEEEVIVAPPPDEIDGEAAPNLMDDEGADDAVVAGEGNMKVVENDDANTGTPSDAKDTPAKRGGKAK